jgi:exosortase
MPVTDEPPIPTEADMISTGGDGAIAAPGAGRPTAARALAQAWWAALALAGLMLALAYAPNLRELYRVWSTDENYGHGFLVIPIAAWVLWGRLKDSPWDAAGEAGSAPLVGWAILVGALAVRAAAYELGYQWVETATILPAIAGLMWAFGGWPLLYRAWPAILFLVFMLPLPGSVNSLVAMPLQRIAATGSYFVLQFLGFWVVQQGNVLQLTTPFGPRLLDVALACNGLKMLMTLAATVTATLLVFPLPVWKRVVLLLSAVPIALVSNIARIVATAWCYYHFEGKSGQEWAHSISGWMMMPLALLLVWLELCVLAWLTPPEEHQDERKALLPFLGAGKAKPPGSAPGRDEV